MRSLDSQPPSPPRGPRRRLRVVREAPAARVARLAVEGLQAELPVIYAWRARYQPRPRTRAQCENGVRPCPFVSCKYNLLVEVAKRTGVLRVNAADNGNGAPAETCALDVAEQGPHSQEEVAVLLGGVTVEQVRQTERTAEAQMRVHGGPMLRATLAEYEPSPSAHVPRAAQGSLADVMFDGLAAERPSAPEIEARAAAALDRWSTEVSALARAGIPLRAAWQIVNHKHQEQEDAMAEKKNAKKAKKKKGGLKAVATPAHETPVVGDTAKIAGEVEIGSAFTQRLPVPIDPVRRDRISEELVQVLGEIDVVNADRSAANGKFNAELKELNEKKRELAEAHRTSTEKRDVRCTMYLLPGNEVIVRRLDNGEITERRTANREELEKLQVPAIGDEYRKPVAHKSFLDEVEEASVAIALPGRSQGSPS